MTLVSGCEPTRGLILLSALLSAAALEASVRLLIGLIGTGRTPFLCLFYFIQENWKDCMLDEYGFGTSIDAAIWSGRNEAV
jgi:predicted ATPase